MSPIRLFLIAVAAVAAGSAAAFAGVALPLAVGVVLCCVAPATAALPSRYTAVGAAGVVAFAPLVADDPLVPAILASVVAVTVLFTKAARFAPFLATAALIVAVYLGETEALVAAAVAGLLATCCWTVLRFRSTGLVAMGAGLSVVATMTLPPLAANAGTEAVTLAVVVAVVSIAVLTSLVVMFRVQGATVRVAAVGLVTLLSASSVGFVDASTQPAAAEPKATKFDHCVALGGEVMESVECYAQLLIEEHESAGLQAAIELIYEMYNSPEPFGPHFINHCHESLHFLGKAAALGVADMTSVIRQGTDLCSAGFGHGIWEVKYALMTNDELIAEAPVICRGWEGLERSEEGSAGIGCRHILGHTLGTRFRGDVAAAAPVCLVRDPAIDPATQPNETEVQSRNNCLAGLFMENILDLTRFRQEDIDRSNPFQVCADERIEGNDDIAWGCYNEVGALVLKHADYDVPDALRMCKARGAEVGLVDWVTESCYDSVSRAIAPHLDYIYDDMIRVCEPIEEPDLRGFCAEGSASTYTFSSLDIAGGVQMCRTILPNEDEWTANCLERVSEIQEVLTASDPSGDRTLTDG